MKKYLVFIVILTLFVSEAYSAKGKKIEKRSAKKIVVGVSEFENLKQDMNLDWLSSAIPESLTTNLGKVKSVTVIEDRKKITSALTKFVKITDVRLGQMIGASILVIGSFQTIGKKIRIDVRFVNIETGQVEGAESFEGEIKKIWDTYPQIVSAILKNLGLPITELEKEKIEKPETLEFKAYKYYGKAKTEDYYEKDREKAQKKIKKLTQEALEIDPNYKKARQLLSETIEKITESFGGDESGMMFLSVEQIPYTMIPNPQYMMNSGEQWLEVNSYTRWYGIGFRSFTVNFLGIKGTGFGLGLNLGLGFTFDFVLEAFYPIVRLGKGTIISPGIGINAGTLEIEQNYAYPSDEKHFFRFEGREYEINQKGLAYSNRPNGPGKPYIIPRAFMAVGVAVTRNFGLFFDIGYRFGIKDNGWQWYTGGKDFNGNGEIEDTEDIPIKREWLQYNRTELYDGFYCGLKMSYYFFTKR